MYQEPGQWSNSSYPFSCTLIAPKIMSERITNYELMVQFKDDRLSHMLKFEGAIQTALGKAYKVTAPTVWLPFTLPTQVPKKTRVPQHLTTLIKNPLHIQYSTIQVMRKLSRPKGLNCTGNSTAASNPHWHLLHIQSLSPLFCSFCSSLLLCVLSYRLLPPVGEEQ